MPMPHMPMSAPALGSVTAMSTVPVEGERLTHSHTGDADVRRAIKRSVCVETQDSGDTRLCRARARRVAAFRRDVDNLLSVDDADVVCGWHLLCSRLIQRE